MTLSSICRTKEIRGYEFPGIIHNGSYFLTDLQVFADGLVNCWEMVDLPMFKRKLGQGWVVTSIPEGASLSIHGIGSVRVGFPEWQHTPKTIVKFVREVVKTLNPRMENLHDCHGRDTEEVNGVRYAAVSRGNPRPWKTDEPISPLVRGHFGQSLRHFRLRDGVYHLVTVHLFKDDSVIIYGAGEPESLSWDELLVQLNELDHLRFPEAGCSIAIDRLVTFTAGEWDYRVDYHELAAEFHDLHNRVHGKPGAIQECMMAFRRYNGEQSAEALRELREKYEAVPEHLRMYCGDMDVKDIPIRMVLYGEGEIENWSHYRAAKARGEDLPSIEIPKPPDENA
jgi:hypothetical protein